MQLLIIVLKSISNIIKCYIIMNTQPYTLYIYICFGCTTPRVILSPQPAIERQPSAVKAGSRRLDYQGVSAQLISTDVLTEKNMHRERIGKLGPMF